MFGSARLMDPSSELKFIISMWSMVALKIDTFDNSFLMVSIEPSREICKKAMHWKVKRPSAIATACPKLFGLKIIPPDLVFIGT